MKVYQFLWKFINSYEGLYMYFLHLQIRTQRWNMRTWHWEVRWRQSYDPQKLPIHCISEKSRKPNINPLQLYVNLWKSRKPNINTLQLYVNLWKSRKPNINPLQLYVNLWTMHGVQKVTEKGISYNNIMFAWIYFYSAL